LEPHLVWIFIVVFQLQVISLKNELAGLAYHQLSVAIAVFL
jgi:hypothetical protein